MCHHRIASNRISPALLAIALLAMCAAGNAFAQTEQVLTNADVMAMSKADLGDDVIIAKIQQAPSDRLDVSTDSLIALKAAGVSKPVINAMVKRVDQRSLKVQATPDRAGSSSQSPALPTPKSIGVIYLLDTNNHSLVSLEKQTAASKTRGLIKQQMVVQITRPKATFRLKTTDTPHFVVTGVDPTHSRLCRFSIKDGTRELILAEGTMTGAKTNFIQVPFEITKFGEAYQFTPSQALTAGEYGFFLTDSEAFCFGVDEP